jgi:hypothetical protein
MLHSSSSPARALALMQPYLFPYLGYFQLVSAVDMFVFYDDAPYPKRGWVNRNRLMIGGREYRFTLPLSDASQFTPINQIEIDDVNFARWRSRFLRTLQQGYAHAPQRDVVLGLVADALRPASRGMAELPERSVSVCAEYLGIQTPRFVSSRDFPAAGGPVRGTDRVIAVCHAASATHYVNAPGGRALYDAALFLAVGITLQFLEPTLTEYPQPVPAFVPRLSILDVLMSLDREAASEAAHGGRVT